MAESHNMFRDHPWHSWPLESSRALWAVCERREFALVERTLDAVRPHPVLGRVLRDVTPAQLQTGSDAFFSRLRRGLEGDWTDYAAFIESCARDAARIAPLGLAECHALSLTARALLLPELVRACAGDATALVALLQSTQCVLDETVRIASEAFRAARPGTHPPATPTPSEHQKFQRLFESGIIGILVCDLIGNIIDANDGFLNMVGYTRAELLSGLISWGDMTPPEWRHLDDVAVQQLQARGVSRTWEKEYYRKDGSRVPILVGVAMLNDAQCIAFILDITERRDLEALRAKSIQLEAQNRRIRESSRLKSEFLANMSHELRTPLNSIIGFADLLHDGEIPANSPQQREFLGDILKSGRHLLQLISDVLDLAKVEAGKLEFRPEPVDLALLAGEVTTVVRGIAAAKHIEVVVEVEPSVAEITGDPSRLKQILYNYVSNALKFTPESGKVWVRARPEGTDRFRLEVEDTGIGIAQADLSRLFVEFQQLDTGTTKRHAGTGLGLALTKRIVEGQQGTVGVTSEPGKGSTFFAVLPRYLSVSNADDPGELSPIAPEGWARLLVVEDDPADRNMLVQVLNGAGYGVEIAETGHHAIERCREWRFDAITLDLLLPDMIGLDVLHRIRGDGLNRETPVFVVSVVAKEGTVGGFSVHDYLRKPIDAQALLDSLRNGRVSPRPSSTIFVVDDDPSSLKLMRTVLERIGYQVQCYADGKLALEALAAARPAAVVLDLMMPGMDGFQFLGYLRQLPENLSIPVIVWTMKELTKEDHTRLSALAQAVVEKGSPKAVSLLDELQLVLRQTLPGK